MVKIMGNDHAYNAKMDHGLILYILICISENEQILG